MSRLHLSLAVCLLALPACDDPCRRNEVDSPCPPFCSTVTTFTLTSEGCLAQRDYPFACERGPSNDGTTCGVSPTGELVSVMSWYGEESFPVGWRLCSSGEVDRVNAAPRCQ